jgi:hypothetical protein
LLLSRDTQLIDYQNAQVILIGAREGHDVIKREIGVEINHMVMGHQPIYSINSRYMRIKLR